MSNVLNRFAFVRLEEGKTHRPSKYCAIVELGPIDHPQTIEDEKRLQGQVGARLVRVFDANDRLRAVGRFYAATQKRAFGRIVHPLKALDDDGSTFPAPGSEEG
jgi:hypothetical protein